MGPILAKFRAEATRWVYGTFKGNPPPKTNMPLEHQAFEDVFPIENGDFSLSC